MYSLGRWLLNQSARPLIVSSSASSKLSPSVLTEAATPAYAIALRSGC